jgi:hypothetical protein
MGAGRQGSGSVVGRSARQANDTITAPWAVPSSRAQIAHSSNVVSMIALRRWMCKISETARQLIHTAIMNLWGRANF